MAIIYCHDDHHHHRPSPKFYDCLDSADSALGDGPDSCRGSCLIANERKRGRKFLVEEKIFLCLASHQTIGDGSDEGPCFHMAQLRILLLTMEPSSFHFVPCEDLLKFF
jgi:hypothetical protein